MASNRILSAVPQPATTGLALSKEPLSGQKFELLFHADQAQGRACDPRALQRVFPERWMAFLHAHFRGPVEVAHVFGVTEKAAEKWWHGCGGPQGAKVALAFSDYPVQARAYLSVVA